MKRAVLHCAVALLLLSCAKHNRNGAEAAARKLPIGVVDEPVDGAVLAGAATFRGWTLCEDGVQQVSIYMDRKYVSNTILGVHRPDVAAVYPNFPHPAQAGWVATVDTGPLAEGPHEFLVQARSNAGLSRDLGIVKATIRH